MDADIVDGGARQRHADAHQGVDGVAVQGHYHQEQGADAVHHGEEQAQLGEGGGRDNDKKKEILEEAERWRDQVERTRRRS